MSATFYSVHDPNLPPGRAYAMLSLCDSGAFSSYKGSDLRAKDFFPDIRTGCFTRTRRKDHASYRDNAERNTEHVREV